MKNKYYVGKLSDFQETKGWFLGSFFPDGHLCKTDQIEILHKKHQQGDIIAPHYHEQKIEVLIFLKGKAIYKINQQEYNLKPGMFLLADVNNVISEKYLKSSEIIAIHSPSLPHDKVTI